MWETPFDTSMLDGRVIILCPSEENAVELMGILGKCGVKWDGSNILASDSDNYWNCRKEQTCYRVCYGQLGYSSIDYYEREGEFHDYTKCTFYGADTPDFEVASDDELTTLLGIGGA